jgi:hypothetical protein
MEKVEKLIGRLRAAKQWSCTIRYEGQIRHGTSTAPFEAADALASLQDRVDRLGTAGRALLDQINEEGPPAQEWQAIGARMDALEAALQTKPDAKVEASNAK